MKDENDKLRDGELPEDPRSGAEPVTPKAKATAEDEARVHTLSGLLRGAHERATTPRQARKILTTGHWKIDRDTGGFRPGHVWIFGAETNWGKSSFLTAVADENLREGHKVLIVTVEDPPEMYGTRLYTRRVQANARNVEAGHLTLEERHRAASLQASNEPVLLDARDRSVEWAEKHARRLMLAENIDLVLFDYLHAFDSEKPRQGQGQERRMQVNYIARTLTNVIKSLNRAGVIFAQITCEDGKKPTKYSIRDSRDVSNAAEVVALGWTPDVDQRRKERDEMTGRVTDGEVIAKAGQRCVIVDKNKSGPAKRLYSMNWNGDGAYFETVPRPMDERDEFFDGLTDGFEEPERRYADP